MSLLLRARRLTSLIVLLPALGSLTNLVIAWTLWILDLGIGRGVPRAYGFPYPCCGVDIYRGFPHVISWHAFILNASLYTAVITVAVVIVAWIRLAQRYRRVVNLQCPKCGYPFNPRCTECGTDVSYPPTGEHAA